MATAIIVDDSKFMRKIIKETLEEDRHQILSEADNGSDGVKQYKKYKPDFITMDITMGGKDGIVAVKEIFAIDSKAKVIIISALNEKTIKMNDKNIRATMFITKPFEKKQLLSAIKSLL